jgi:hypothetical protein
LPDGGRQGLGLHLRGIVFHGGGGSRQVRHGFGHPGGARQFPFHGVRAVAARHPVDGQVQRFDCHIYMMRQVEGWWRIVPLRTPAAATPPGGARCAQASNSEPKFGPDLRKFFDSWLIRFE